jgi:ABC-2 type transport system permease protein
MVMPLLFLVVFGSGFGNYFSYKNDMSYSEFIGPGIVGMQLLFDSIFGGMSVLWDRQFGFLKEILVAPVSRFAIMTGKTLGTVTTSMIKALVFLLALLIGGLVKTDAGGVVTAIVFMILISAAFVSLGIAMATVMTDPHGFQLVMNFLVMPIFFLSGALFPLENLPHWLSVLTRFNPLTYGIDGMRYALGGPHMYSPMLSGVILAGFWVVTSIVGARLFRTMPA